MTTRIELILNPASGSHLALSLVETHIRPLLLSSLSSSSQLRVRETESVGDGVRIGREIIDDYLSTSLDDAGEYLDIVLVGGDGTTHEVLNGLYISCLSSLSDKVEGENSGKLPRVRLAIVPSGTANALYSAMYPTVWTQNVQQKVASAKSIADIPAIVVEIMLRSVTSLSNSLKRKHESSKEMEELPLMQNTLQTEEGEKVTISHLVTSHALHAAILYDADTPQMRNQYNGIERFKVAAQQNATLWTQGSLTLHPISLSEEKAVKQYVLSSKTFESISEEKVELKGPFLYLTAMVTDRLESEFVPAPLSSAFKSTTSGGLPKDAVDVVIIRPTRDPSLAGVEEKEAGLQFATQRLGEITKGMYTGGKHIDLTYPEGVGMVEYYRCSGYTFKPSSEDKEEGRREGKEKLVCTDGFISFASQTDVRRWNRDSTATRAQSGESRRVRDLDAPLIWR